MEGEGRERGGERGEREKGEENRQQTCQEKMHPTGHWLILVLYLQTLFAYFSSLFVENDKWDTLSF